MIQPDRVRVWDIPTRLFHWLIVLFFAVSWWSAENHEMERHYWSGSIMLGLILFRLIWGVIGGSTARFASFVRSPGAVFAYLRSKESGGRAAGHNPLGAYSVIAMIAMLVLQVGTGLFAGDTDGLESGPLSPLVSFDQTQLAADIHGISFNILLALIGLHILAILYYTLVRKHGLLRAMITGADVGIDAGKSSLAPAPFWRLGLALLIAAGLAWWISKGMPF
jgi:cytochrome b